MVGKFFGDLYGAKNNVCLVQSNQKKPTIYSEQERSLPLNSIQSINIYFSLNN